MTVVYAILAFCIMIIVHEMGHFFAAKAFGMKVYEFSLGMGPTILKKKGKNTDYCLKLLPLGGSVQLGEDEESDDPNSFRNKPVWQRMIVIVAGAIMNLILGIIVCAITLCVSGYSITTTIGGFRGDEPVSNQYLQVGDQIVEINGMSIWSSQDISYALQNKVAKSTDDSSTVSIDFKVVRDGQTVTLNDVIFNATTTEGGTGKSIVLDFYVNTEELSFGTVMSGAFKNAASYGRLVIMSLIDLLSGTYGINDLSGPVGVVKVMSEAASQSQNMTVNISSLLSMISLITINLGIFNLLPIPALDGMRFVFLLIEAIRRKPIKPDVEGMIHFVGLAALMLLMLFVTFNDISKLVSGG